MQTSGNLFEIMAPFEIKQERPLHFWGLSIKKKEIKNGFYYFILLKLY
jgi:hypothetical protein